MRSFFFAVTFCFALGAQPADQAIRALLDRQVADWNRGDVRAFMQGYDDSDATLFVGSSVIRGHQRVLENYVKRYGSKEKMGTLTFTILEIRPLGAEHALVLGKFHLERTAEGGGNSEGYFTLTFEKKSGSWKIIADHTS